MNEVKLQKKHDENYESELMIGWVLKFKNKHEFRKNVVYTW